MTPDAVVQEGTGKLLQRGLSNHLLPGQAKPILQLPAPMATVVGRLVPRLRLMCVARRLFEVSVAELISCAAWATLSSTCTMPSNVWASNFRVKDLG